MDINGIVPVIPTPFQPNEEIDLAAVCDLIDFACSSGAVAACLPAYASEFYKLSENERVAVVAEAATHAAGRIPIIAQVNAAGARGAKEAIRLLQDAGADAIGISVPRIFATRDDDIARYFDAVLPTAEIPVMIQDFNPSGVVVSAPFVAELRRRHPQFRYLKLEEPLAARKIRQIVEESEGQVGVLEGWGGMYMLELFQAGICGVVPGLAVSDLLAFAWGRLRSGSMDEAYDVFASVLPQIVFSLQNMEFFHFAEKRLLEARGILRAPVVRRLTLEPSDTDRAHVDFLNSRILQAVERFGLQRAVSSTE